MREFSFVIFPKIAKIINFNTPKIKVHRIILIETMWKFWKSIRGNSWVSWNLLIYPVRNGQYYIRNLMLITNIRTAWKVSKYGVFSGSYFPAFVLNTERYCISPYSVRMRENPDQKKLRIWTLFTQWRITPDIF